MAERIPVLLVSPTADAGGAERAFASLARRLPDVGFAPTVALLAHGPLEDWLAQVDCEPTLVEGDAVDRLEALARAAGARVVVSNKSAGHVAGGAAALRLGVPAVYWQQDLVEDEPRHREAAAVPAAAIVCISDIVLEAQRALAPSARLEKIHLGAPVADIAARRGSGAEVRRVLGWPTEPLVGVVGRLEGWKGQDVFVETAALLSGTRPDLRFVLVGDETAGSGFRARLEQLAAERGLADVLRLVGHQDDVFPWFDALDIVVHTSYREPFGLVLVEAMALGKPLVASASGAPLEIVEEGRSGFLVQEWWPPALAEAIERILGDPGLATWLGEGAAVRAAAFDESVMAERFGSVLRSVLGS